MYPQIRIWHIPTTGLKSNLDESQLELSGHLRKVLLLEWHPTAANVLFSVGFDHLVSYFVCLDNVIQLKKKPVYLAQHLGRFGRRPNSADYKLPHGHGLFVGHQSGRLVNSDHQ